MTMGLTVYKYGNDHYATRMVGRIPEAQLWSVKVFSLSENGDDHESVRRCLETRAKEEARLRGIGRVIYLDD
ncbi:hypothetical protein HY224_03490 [Candidatus Uhrbacteria bacterium]|nr:hypothetical protein [Candidatus Uhrbacteria bacterium]